ncbi:heat shock 70 kDa protein 12B-like [Magallana gigas]|uniref:heat shock 70 kDa protein 12B-like n=1 Tax=Magallana gigas TaxID=29159 RepID=UPI0033418FCD
MSRGLLVAAIQIDTEFSSCAFSTVSDFSDDPMKIMVNSWRANNAIVSNTTSTCILFDSGGTFHSFGYEAEKHYSELALDDQHIDWYFFKRFPIKLFKSKRLTRKTVLEDVNGKKMEALKVFSSVIGYLKDNMRKESTQIKDCDITMVLTAPVILNDTVKQFMRGAAEKVGICGDRLLIVPEPEAASVYCMYQPVQHAYDNRLFDPGAKYMIIIAEARTVEMTVYEVQHGVILKELYKADKCDWGGTMVDESFLSLLADIVGNDVMDAFRSECSDSFCDLLRNFQCKKRSLRPDETRKITIPLSGDLLYTFDEIKPEGEIDANIESKPKYKNSITLLGDKLRMEAHIAISLFEESCSKIIYHMQELFRYPHIKDVSSILLVGEYAESNILQANIRKAFDNKLLFVPHPAEYAVLKGAVLYGHRQQKDCK